MKRYNILKDFEGSQTGLDGPNLFKAGTTAELSDHLAEVAVEAGLASLAEQVDHAEAVEAAEIADEQADEASATAVEQVDEPSAPAEERETKVEQPEETKAVNLEKMTKVELVTYAKTEFDLDLVPDSMTKAEMIAEIEAALNA